MKLDKFLKDLFGQECVKGYEISCVEAHVTTDGEICHKDASLVSAKVIIEPQEKEND